MFPLSCLIVLRADILLRRGHSLVAAIVMRGLILGGAIAALMSRRSSVAAVRLLLLV